MSLSAEFSRFPEGWRVLPFLEAISDVTSGNHKVKVDDYQEAGLLPVVDQGQALFGGYVDDVQVACNVELPVIVFGDHTRRFKFIEEPFALGADGAKVLKPKAGLDPKFAFYYLSQTPIESAGYSRHFKFLKEKFVPVPPMDVQRHIAKVLEQADCLRRQAQQMEAELNRLAQALFLDMFGDPIVNPKAWGKVSVSHFVDEFEGGKSLAGAGEDHEGMGYRVLKISAVTWGEFNPEQSKPLPSDYQPEISHFVRKGDLLFSRANTTELVGATSYVFDEHENLLLPDKLWRFAWNRCVSVSPIFIWFLFMSRSVRVELGKLSSGSGGSMKNISKAKLMRLKVIFPPVELQQDFERKYLEIRRAAVISRSETVEYDRVFSSLVQRAFKGELAPKLA